jgi:DNA-binding winged helix-turn-helix (wHTH) protein
MSRKGVACGRGVLATQLPRPDRPDRLLEGEDPRSLVAHDARHWIAVYREMISFKDDLLARISSRLDGLPRSALQDVLDNDVGLIQEQLERYQRRIEYWFARQWELEGLEIDYADRTIKYRDSSINLTKRELQLLVLLVSRSPMFTTTGQLLVQAWHDSRLPEESMRTYIGRVRAKLVELGVGAQIVNRPHKGYALMFDEPAERHKGSS